MLHCFKSPEKLKAEKARKEQRKKARKSSTNEVLTSASPVDVVSPLAGPAVASQPRPLPAATAAPPPLPPVPAAAARSTTEANREAQADVRLLVPDVHEPMGKATAKLTPDAPTGVHKAAAGGLIAEGHAPAGPVATSSAASTLAAAAPSSPCHTKNDPRPAVSPAAADIFSSLEAEHGLETVSGRGATAAAAAERRLSATGGSSGAASPVRGGIAHPPRTGSNPPALASGGSSGAFSPISGPASGPVPGVSPGMITRANGSSATAAAAQTGGSTTATVNTDVHTSPALAPASAAAPTSVTSGAAARIADLPLAVAAGMPAGNFAGESSSTAGTPAGTTNTAAGTAGTASAALAGSAPASNIHRTGPGPIGGEDAAVASAGTSGGAETLELVCQPGSQKAPVPSGMQHFIVREEHATEKERVSTWIEHQPVHREYQTSVEATGRVEARAPFKVPLNTPVERVVEEHTCYPVDFETVVGVAGHPGSNVEVPTPDAAPANPIVHADASSDIDTEVSEQTLAARAYALGAGAVATAQQAGAALISTIWPAASNATGAQTESAPAEGAGLGHEGGAVPIVAPTSLLYEPLGDVVVQDDVTEAHKDKSASYSKAEADPRDVQHAADGQEARAMAERAAAVVSSSTSPQQSMDMINERARGEAIVNEYLSHPPHDAVDLAFKHATRLPTSEAMTHIGGAALEQQTMVLMPHQAPTAASLHAANTGTAPVAVVTVAAPTSAATLASTPAAPSAISVPASGHQHVSGRASSTTSGTTINSSVYSPRAPATATGQLDTVALAGSTLQNDEGLGTRLKHKFQDLLGTNKGKRHSSDGVSAAAGPALMQPSGAPAISARRASAGHPPMTAVQALEVLRQEAAQSNVHHVGNGQQDGQFTTHTLLVFSTSFNGDKPGEARPTWTQAGHGMKDELGGALYEKDLQGGMAGAGTASHRLGTPHDNAIPSPLAPSPAMPTINQVPATLSLPPSGNVGSHPLPPMEEAARTLTTKQVLAAHSPPAVSSSSHLSPMQAEASSNTTMQILRAPPAGSADDSFHKAHGHPPTSLSLQPQPMLHGHGTAAEVSAASTAVAMPDVGFTDQVADVPPVAVEQPRAFGSEMYADDSTGLLPDTLNSSASFVAEASSMDFKEALAPLTGDPHLSPGQAALAPLTGDQTPPHTDLAPPLSNQGALASLVGSHNTTAATSRPHAAALTSASPLPAVEDSPYAAALEPLTRSTAVHKAAAAEPLSPIQAALAPLTGDALPPHADLAAPLATQGALAPMAGASASQVCRGEHTAAAGMMDASDAAEQSIYATALQPLTTACATAAVAAPDLPLSPYQAALAPLTGDVVPPHTDLMAPLASQGALAPMAGVAAFSVDQLSTVPHEEPSPSTGAAAAPTGAVSAQHSSAASAALPAPQALYQVALAPLTGEAVAARPDSATPLASQGVLSPMAGATAFPTDKLGTASPGVAPEPSPYANALEPLTTANMSPGTVTQQIQAAAAPALSQLQAVAAPAVSQLRAAAAPVVGALTSLLSDKGAAAVAGAAPQPERQLAAGSILGPQQGISGAVQQLQEASSFSSFSSSGAAVEFNGAGAGVGSGASQLLVPAAPEVAAVSPQLAVGTQMDTSKPDCHMQQPRQPLQHCYTDTGVATGGFTHELAGPPTSIPHRSSFEFGSRVAVDSGAFGFPAVSMSTFAGAFQESCDPDSFDVENSRIYRRRPQLHDGGLTPAPSNQSGQDSLLNTGAGHSDMESFYDSGCALDCAFQGRSMDAPPTPPPSFVDHGMQQMMNHNGTSSSNDAGNGSVAEQPSVTATTTNLNGVASALQTAGTRTWPDAAAGSADSRTRASSGDTGLGMPWTFLQGSRNSTPASGNTPVGSPGTSSLMHRAAGLALAPVYISAAAAGYSVGFVKHKLGRAAEVRGQSTGAATDAVMGRAPRTSQPGDSVVAQVQQIMADGEMVAIEQQQATAPHHSATGMADAVASSTGGAPANSLLAGSSAAGIAN